MKTSKLRRLSMLLPAVVALSTGIGSPARALQLTASEYSTRIAQALASLDLGSAEASVKILKSCGVTSIAVGNNQVTMEQLDEIIYKLRAGATVSLDDLAGGAGGSVFIVGEIKRTDIDCKVDVAVRNDEQTSPSST